jgi:flavin reductase (DIM6/NTAB) family NADH-FMN oxidoreductase RutF
MVTTARKGRPNVMTMSWHTMMEFEPPLVGCVISGRNYSFEALTKTRECVLNIPTASLVEKVLKAGSKSGRKMDKFSKIGLTPRPASKVKAPLIDECYASLECRVYDTRLVNKYNFFVLEVVKAWVDAGKKNPRTLHHSGRGVFRVAGKTIKLRTNVK